MPIRYARTNELGLTVPPPQLDCLQEECPTALVTGRCFVDEHHLYFPRAKFSGDPLLTEFATNPFNVVRLPRCRHNSRFPGSQHAMYDDVRIPDRDVIQEFLWEAYVLKEISQLACRLEVLYESLSTNNVRRVARNPERSVEMIEEFSDQMKHLTLMTGGLEVIPEVQKTSLHVVGARGFHEATRKIPGLKVA